MLPASPSASLARAHSVDASKYFAWRSTCGVARGVRSIMVCVRERRGTRAGEWEWGEEEEERESGSEGVKGEWRRGARTTARDIARVRARA
eukprot:352003-Rhodomonas_salina.1